MKTALEIAKKEGWVTIIGHVPIGYSRKFKAKCSLAGCTPSQALASFIAAVVKDDISMTVSPACDAVSCTKKIIACETTGEFDAYRVRLFDYDSNLINPSILANEDF